MKMWLFMLVLMKEVDIKDAGSISSIPHDNCYNE